MISVETAKPKKCLICEQDFEYVAYGICGQQKICSTCVLRPRFLKGTTKCDYCETNHDHVFVTQHSPALNRRFVDFSTFPPNPIEGRAGFRWYNEDTKAFFDDFDEYSRIKAMCKFSCTLCGETEFQCVGELMIHLFQRHRRYICHICYQWKEKFICEHILFTKEQLNQHIRTGDSEVDGTLVERGGFSGHRFCELCKNPFYGNKDVYIHSRKDSCTCHICHRMMEDQCVDIADHFIRNHTGEADKYWRDNFSIVRAFKDENAFQVHNTSIHQRTRTSISRPHPHGTIARARGTMNRNPPAQSSSSSVPEISDTRRLGDVEEGLGLSPRTNVSPSDHQLSVQQPTQNQSSSIQNSNQYQGQAQVRFRSSSASSATSDHARTRLAPAPASSSAQFSFPPGGVSSSYPPPLSVQKPYLSQSQARFSSSSDHARFGMTETLPLAHAFSSLNTTTQSYSAPAHASSSLNTTTPSYSAPAHASSLLDTITQSYSAPTHASSSLNTTTQSNSAPAQSSSSSVPEISDTHGRLGDVEEDLNLDDFDA